MHGGGDDPAQAERRGARQNGGRDVMLLHDFLSKIKGRHFRKDGKGDQENGDAEGGEDQGVDEWGTSHGSGRVESSLYEVRRP